MESLIGHTLDDKYRIESLLGQGGTGAVYKAHDIDSNVDRAIYVIYDLLAQDREIRDCFQRKAPILASLDHPGIVRVLDYSSEEAPHLYLIMEFVNGPNLHQRLEDLEEHGQEMELLEAVKLVCQVCDAVAYLHSQDPPILHGDIKPGNIILRPESGSVLSYRPVLRLGLATLLQDDVEAQGPLVGTPAYMSPERALGKALDPRSDVWSLGVLLYELVTGRLPFQPKTPDEIVEEHRKGIEPPLPSSIRPALGLEVDGVILKALQTEPARRYPGVSDMAKALADLPLTTQSARTEETPTVVDEETQPEQFPTPLSGDCVFVLAPDGTGHWMPIEANTLIIGRGPNNDLNLQPLYVSRSHAEITFDGASYWVEDLGSANGTWLGESKLAPYQPEEWVPGAVLCIGEYRLFLQRSRPVGSTVPAGMLVASDLSVSPGDLTETPITLINFEDEPDAFELAVDGVPEDWVTLHPSHEIHLMPRNSYEVKLSIQPPKRPESAAGRYELKVQARSVNHPPRVVEEPTTLTVLAYHEFKGWLTPAWIEEGTKLLTILTKERPTARVTVENQGNISETYDVIWIADADDLQFDPPATQLTVAAGQEATAESSVRPPSRLLGQHRPHGLCARVRSPDGEEELPRGQLVSKALLPISVELAALIVTVLSLVVTVLSILVSRGVIPWPF